MNSSVLLAAVMLAGLQEAAHAQSAVASGKLDANKPAIAQHCAACHGENGEGQAGAPRIAGQPRRYIEKQLQSYANGSRRNPVMEGIAKALSPQEMARFAAYYSERDAPATKVGVALDSSAELIKHGEELALKGNPVRRVQACINCHGPEGAGQPPSIPYLSGLDAGYLVASMAAWKEGTRKNDAGQQMATVVQGMTADDMAAVAQYYAALRPPKPLSFDVVTPPMAPNLSPPAPPPSSQQRSDNSAAVQGRDQPAAAKPAALINRPARAGDPARGRAIVASGTYGCAACHAIPGIPGTKGVAGPPLTGLAGRSLLAGQLPNNADVLVAFLQNPPSLVPRTGMPNVGLDAGQARDIAAFLYTLEPGHAR
jgi:cytochrome c553